MKTLKLLLTMFFAVCLIFTVNNGFAEFSGDGGEPLGGEPLYDKTGDGDSDDDVVIPKKKSVIKHNLWDFNDVIDAVNQWVDENVHPDCLALYYGDDTVDFLLCQMEKLSTPPDPVNLDQIINHYGPEALSNSDVRISLSNNPYNIEDEALAAEMLESNVAHIDLVAYALGTEKELLSDGEETTEYTMKVPEGMAINVAVVLDSLEGVNAHPELQASSAACIRNDPMTFVQTNTQCPWVMTGTGATLREVMDHSKRTGVDTYWAGRPNGPIPYKERVVVAVIDAGVDYNHPEIMRSLAVRQCEVPTAVKTAADSNTDGHVDIGELMNWANVATPGALYANTTLFNNQNDCGSSSLFPTDSIFGVDVFNNDNNPIETTIAHGTNAVGVLTGGSHNSLAGTGTGGDILTYWPIKVTNSTTTTNANTIKAIKIAKEAGFKRILVGHNPLHDQALYNEALDYVLGSIGNIGDPLRIIVSGTGNVTTANPTLVGTMGNEIIWGAVGAVDLTNGLLAGTRPTFKTFAPTSLQFSEIDLVTPGSLIYTTAPGGGYTTVSGTSFAAPSYLAAIEELNKDYKSLTNNNDIFISLLIAAMTTKKLGHVSAPTNVTGRGLLDLKEAKRILNLHYNSNDPVELDANKVTCSVVGSNIVTTMRADSYFNTPDVVDKWTWDVYETSGQRHNIGSIGRVTGIRAMLTWGHFSPSKFTRTIPTTIIPNCSGTGSNGNARNWINFGNQPGPELNPASALPNQNNKIHQP